MKALRSKDFQQCRNELVHVEIDASGEVRRSYCCLGVYAEVENLWSTASLAEKTVVEGSPTGLPYHVLDKNDQSHLIDMNDSDGYTFSNIADWIDKNVRVKA